METKLFNIDRTREHSRSQPQAYTETIPTAVLSRKNAVLNSKSARPQTKAPASPAKPMLKARALSLANAFKRGTALASLVTFGIVGGLVAFPQFQTAVKPTHSSSTVKHVTPTTSTSQKSNSFFQQQGGNSLGSQDALQGTSTTTPTATSTPAYTQGGTSSTSGYTPPATVNNTPSYKPQAPVSGSSAS